MSHQKMEPKLVSKVEAPYISKHYKIPIKVVRDTMKEIGKNGKPARSRVKIYAALRLKGFKIKTKKFPAG